MADDLTFKIVLSDDPSNPPAGDRQWRTGQRPPYDGPPVDLDGNTPPTVPRYTSSMLTPQPAGTAAPAGTGIPRYTSSMIQPTGENAGESSGTGIPRYTSSMIQPSGPAATAEAGAARSAIPRYTSSMIAPPAAGGAASTGAAATGAEAGAGAAGAAGAAAAAGPAAIAVVAAEATAESFKKAGKAVEATGESLKMVAGNDTLGLFKKGVEGASDKLEQIGIAGKVAAEGLRLVGTVVTTFADTAQAFIDRGKQLQSYSSDLAQANAMAGVRTLQSDIKEAQATGPATASLTESFSVIENTFREMLLPIKKIVVEVLAGMAKRIADAVEVLSGIATPILELLSSGLKQILSALSAIYEATVGKVVGWLKSLFDLFSSKELDKYDLTKEFFKLAEGQGFGAEDLRRMGQDSAYRQQAMEEPLFGGI